MFRILLVATLLGLTLLPEATSANSTNMTRQEIKSMPITHRPNRPGHFYGNTVRRRDRRN